MQGTLIGAPAPVAMDLYAVAAGSEVRVDALAPGPMGEATTYGSAFARGSRLTEPGRSTIYVSGTASIDGRGGVVAVGDIAGQLACMFDNVRALLTAAGMELRDTLSATVYLKSAEHLRAFVEAAAAAGLPADVPAAVVVTQICRPEWLCEIELCAARLASVDKT